MNDEMDYKYDSWKTPLENLLMELEMYARQNTDDPWIREELIEMVARYKERK